MDLLKVQRSSIQGYNFSEFGDQIAKMKGFLLIILLAVTHGYATVDGEDLPEAPLGGPEGINTFSGSLSLGDTNGRMMSSTSHSVERSMNVAHTQEVLVRLVEYANITGIRVTPTGNTVAPSLIDGGLGYNYVKLGFTSQLNLGYVYRIVIYGSLVCDD